MIYSRPAMLAFVSAGIVFRTVAVRAVPVLGNLAQPAQDRAVSVSLNEWQGSSFRLSGSAFVWRVRSLTLRMAQLTANESFSFRIVGESALRPALADVRATFTMPLISSTESQNITFNAKDFPSPVLHPGQTYWIVAGVERQDGNFTPATGRYYWSYALNNATDFAPAAGWSFGSATASAGTAGANWAPEATTPFSFSIDATIESPLMTLSRWRQSNPGGPADNSVWLRGDHNNNNLPGLIDFAFNADRGALPIPFLHPSGRPALEFVRWISAPELTWRIQTSPDLSDWTWTTDYDATSVPDGPETERVRVVLRQPSSHLFMRLNVTRQ